MALDELLEADADHADTAGGGGAGPDWAADIDPFPTEPTVAFEVNEPAMTSAFDPVTVSTANHLCAALVDLTGNPTMPPYAGINDEEVIFAGSLVKICALYAAFALRAQVQVFVDAAVANSAPITPPDITRAIEQAWKPRLRALFPARSTTSFGNNQDVTFPRLDEIFVFSPDGRVDFARATPPLADAQIDAVGEFGAPQGGFHDWMRSMLRWSNNTAASKCILALGYFYLNGSLARAGFFDAGSGGLWLSADYGGHDWVRTATEKQGNAAGQELAPRWAAAQGRRLSNITATASQLARFLTLMAQDQLVDATASAEMRALMDVTSGGIGSYAKAALDAAARDSTAFSAKIGFGDDSFSHDCAIIERTVDGKDLRYVAVGLGSAPNRRRVDLSDLFVLLDEAIVTRNA
ncbi:MAG: serine hydrolase [Burkholderiales bacterium]